MRRDEEPLAIKAAILYFEDEKSQGEIGNILGVSRWKVGRLIADAKRSGFVKVEIAHPLARRLPLERDLCAEFGLTDAVVASNFGLSNNAEELRERVAVAAAEYLTALEPVPRILGVSWGRTLHAVSQNLREGWSHGLNVVQINGGVSVNRQANSAADTAAMFARKASGTVTLLPSPAILEHRSTRDAIESDRGVSNAREFAGKSDTYLFSAGLASPESVLVTSGYLSAPDMSLLVEKGAIGDVVGRFISAEGQIVDTDLDERTVGVTLHEIRAAARSIAVIAGSSKVDLAKTVVRGGLCTTLITDEKTALYILGKQL